MKKAALRAGLAEYSLLLLAALVAFCGLGYLLWYELDSRALVPLQVDDLYFLSCAVRAVTQESGVLVGCHDNKGPLTYIAYALLSQSTQLYDLAPIKITGTAFVLLNALLAAWLSERWAGRQAAIVTLVLAMGLVFIDPSFLAFKTESLAVMFTLLGIGLLTHRVAGDPTGPFRLMAAGALFGVAIMSNQKFVVIWGAAALWIWLAIAAAPAGQQDKFTRRHVHSIAIFSAGTAVPFLLLLGTYALFGRAHEYLASLFLYASLYGTAADGNLAQVIGWRLGLVAQKLRPFLLYVSVAVFACVFLMRGILLRTAGWSATSWSLFLISLAMAAYGLLCLSFSILFGYHFMPVFVLASIMAGVGYSSLAKLIPDVCFRLFMPLLLIHFLASGAIAMWFGMKDRAQSDTVFKYLVTPTQGDYAYVAGVWPGFYVFNQLIPASDVLYPHALHGAQPSPFFRLPAVGSVKRQLLDKIRGENERKLTSDFQKTPPRYIYVEDTWAHLTAASSTDLTLLNEYIAIHCEHTKRVTQVLAMHDGDLFTCP
jgi:hypothetical protein